MYELELVLAIAVGIVIVVIVSVIAYAVVFAAKVTALEPVPTIVFEVESIHNLLG